MIRETVRSFYCEFRQAPCNNPECKKGDCIPEREFNAKVLDKLSAQPQPSAEPTPEELAWMQLDHHVKMRTREMARAIIRQHLTKTGRRKKDVPKDVYDAEVQRIAALPEIISLAKGKFSN